MATYRLADQFEEHGIEHVDFCSIDTEGSELKVVQSIDYQKVQVDFFSIENNDQQTDVERFLKSHGYRKVERVEWDDVYAHPVVLDDWWRRKRARRSPGVAPGSAGSAAGRSGGRSGTGGCGAGCGAQPGAAADVRVREPCGLGVLGPASRSRLTPAARRRPPRAPRSSGWGSPTPPSPARCHRVPRGAAPR